VRGGGGSDELVEGLDGAGAGQLRAVGVTVLVAIGVAIPVSVAIGVAVGSVHGGGHDVVCSGWDGMVNSSLTRWLYLNYVRCTCMYTHPLYCTLI
jgi:hypothetical protein